MTRKITTTIQVDKSTMERMEKLKIGDESFNTVILRLLDTYQWTCEMYSNEIGTRIIEGFK